MRIAFVTAYPPAPMRVRAYSFLRQLAFEHEVTAVALCHNERELEELLALRAEGIHTLAVREAAWRPVARAAGALAVGKSLQERHGAAPALRRAVHRLVELGQVDLVHVEHLRAVSSVRGLAVPVVWDSVDCISQLYRLGAQYGATSMIRRVGALEATRAREAEQRLLADLSHVIVTSARERAALLGTGPAVAPTGERRRSLLSTHTITPSRQASVHVIANGVDASYFAPMAMPHAPDVIVFSGKMSFHGNAAACAELTREIMPRIWRHRPQVKLVIAGANPPRTIRALAADPRITVTGYVSDLRPYLASATVAVSPTPYAAGIQNKVLEALAMGTPVVAMPASVGGLHVTPGRELLVAESASAVAHAILRLLDQPRLREQLAREGRRYVLRQHSWQTAAARLVAVYEAAVETGPRPALMRTG
jgi:glycosyltransferase involved in cell wall biosynthesis